MKPYNAYELPYETMEMLGQTVLFTDMRVDRTTVPEGLYAYSLRHDDDCQGDICEIAPSVMVNFWGTILCREEIPLTDDGRRYVDENDYTYTGDSMSIEEYMEQDTGQSEEMEVNLS